jgi:hypothetical protein
MKSLYEAYKTIERKLPIEDKKIADRLRRARDEVLDYGYEVELILRDDKEVVYRIEKLSTSLLEDNSKTYRTTLKECDCPDFPSARAGLCKHRIAVMIREEMLK